MQFNLSQDVANWLDAMRGSTSRQAYITAVLRKQIESDKENHIYLSNNTETTKENNATHNTNGAIDALSQN